MLEFTLLTALIALLIAINLFFRNSGQRWRRIRKSPRRLYAVLLSVCTIGLLSCGNNENDTNAESVKITTQDDDYEVYFTQEDIDELREELPDSMGIIMTNNEFRGMRLFMMHCNKCHPGGEQGAGPSLNDKPLPDFLIHFQIRQGMGDMPAFTKDELTKEEVGQIVRYVRFMRKNYLEAKAEQ